MLPIDFFRVRRTCCDKRAFPYYVVLESSFCPHSWGNSLSGKRTRRRMRLDGRLIVNGTAVSRPSRIAEAIAEVLAGLQV
jgi:hypothetical protein